MGTPGLQGLAVRRVARAASGFALCCLVGGLCHAGGVVLVKKGLPRATIVVGPAPSAAASGAAAELAAYLERISGAAVPVAAAASGPGTRILVGLSAAVPEAARLGLTLPTGLTAQFAEEGYVVCAEAQTLVLAGNETEPYQGTWFAVSDLLESLGCRWYFPGEFGEVVPRLDDIVIARQNRLVRPDLRVRDTWYSGHLPCDGQQTQEFIAWRRHNRMCRFGFWLHCADPEARYLQNPVDDSTWRLLPKEKYWASHPEYYALRPGGARNERFLCMSNPGAFQAAADTICEFFAAHPSFHAFAFSPPDEAVLCHCPDCTRGLSGRFGGEGWGDVSDPYFRFVFALADKVRERYPDRWITTMAYYNRCRPPQGVTGKHPNVLIQLASIQQCSLHSYRQSGCWTRRQFATMLEQWAGLTAGQVFYEYDPHDWSHLQRPCWRSRSEGDDLRLLKRLGGWGFSDEGQMAWLSTGLNYWVRARLAWDVDADSAAMVQDFCERFFGPAAGPMRRFYGSVEQALRSTRAHSGEGGHDDWQVILPPRLLDQCEAWLDTAAKRAAVEPYQGRVAAFRIYFDRIHAYGHLREAMNRADFGAAAQEADRMLDAVARMNNTALLQDAGPWGGERSGAALGKVARDLAAWTTGPRGKLVAVLPPVARFRTDPGADGVVGQWYRPTLPRGPWQALKLSASWAAQGIVTPQGRPYRGVAWYRSEVGLQNAPAGAVRLLVPELAGSGVWVWCNGAYAGYAGGTDDKPLSVDLTGLLRQGTNALVLRVDGDSGLSLPPFIFTPGDAADFPDKRHELSVFPAQWLFRLDPHQAGDKEGWAKAGQDDTGWQAIPVPSAWEKTPVGAYDGDAWYRVRFTVPAAMEGRRLVLHFGAVDEEAWVYLNGELQGEHTTASTGQTVHQIWDKPFAIPLQNARAGQENTLVVKVRDSLGAGGIFLPVKLYEIP
jgi:hypothetical protein